MRLHPRYLALAFVATALLSCGRELTGPATGRVANIALDPQSARLQSDLIAVSRVVTFTKVRIVATNNFEVEVAQKVVSFPTAADSIRLSLAIPLPDEGGSSSFPVWITLAYINAQNDTVFRGGASATVGGTGSSQPLTIPITYSGIGANATRVTLTPDTGTVLPATSTTFVGTTFVGTALDSLTPIPGTPLYYYTPDTNRALIASPAVPTVQWRASRGIARIIALHPDGLKADTSTFTVTLPASKLVVKTGAGQTALGSTALPAPIVVRTLAADDVPVAGVVVDFAVSTGGGTLSIVKDTSDVNGEVSTSWTLGTLIGTQSITATAAGLTPSPLTIGAVASAGPTGIAINITSPIGASRYYAIVTGPGIPDEIIAEHDASFARTTTLNLPLPAGSGYSIYLLAADSLAASPDSLPVISAGMKLTPINIVAGNTSTVPVTLQPVSVVGSVPSSVTAGSAFAADVILTDPSRLFYEILSGMSLFRADSNFTFDRGGGGVVVGNPQILSATEKRFTSAPFRPSAAGTIYSQYGAGIVSTDRAYTFFVLGPSRQRGESLLSTTVLPANSGIRVNITAPATVTRFVVAVDTGAGPIAWGGATSAGMTTATIDVPVPPGTNYRVRVAALQNFSFNVNTAADLAGLRAGIALTGQVVSAGFTNVSATLVAQTAAPGVLAAVASGLAIPFAGTMRDPSLFNATAPCLMRYSTAGPIAGANLGTFLNTACTISNRQADGTFTVTGTFPAVPGPATLHTQVFTSVIGYSATGSRIEMAHQGISITTISAP